MALVGGLQAAPGRIMGHAGAFAAPGESDVQTKIRAFEDAGVTVVNNPSKFGEGMKSLFAAAKRERVSSATSRSIQKRGVHTLKRPYLSSQNTSPSSTRSLFIRQSQAFDILRNHGIVTTDKISGTDRLLAITVDRSRRCPCIVVSPTIDAREIQQRRFPFDYREGFDVAKVPEIAEYLRLETNRESLQELLSGLVDLFMSKEAFILDTRVNKTLHGNLVVSAAKLGFDDAAYRSANRQGNIHQLRNVEEEDSEEVEAEKDGIVYIKFVASAAKRYIRKLMLVELGSLEKATLAHLLTALVLP